MLIVQPHPTPPHPPAPPLPDCRSAWKTTLKRGEEIKKQEELDAGVLNLNHQVGFQFWTSFSGGAWLSALRILNDQRGYFPTNKQLSFKTGCCIESPTPRINFCLFLWMKIVTKVT